MKKLFKVVIKIVLIGVILVCLVNALDILEFSDFMQVSRKDNIKYSNYYFNNLNEGEKTIYIKMAKAVEEGKTEFSFLNIKDGSINEKIKKVFESYINDNPDVYYISNKYSFVTKSVLIFEYNKVNIQYDTLLDTNKGKEKIDNAIKNFLNGLIYSDMTDFEKEVAIHDKLINKMKYYEFEDVNNIPNIKHSAYGALIENEAVCDGYSKAFKMLLNKVGIESIIVLGNLEGEPHAWNIVNIEGNYYHVDVTSDSLNENNKRYPIHVYLNLTDTEISRTHGIDKQYQLPECNKDEYNYYNYTNNILKLSDNIYSKLGRIIQNGNNKEIIEFKNEDNISSNKIVNALYELDFDRWMTRGVSNIKYNKINDIYVFKKL